MAVDIQWIQHNTSVKLFEDMRRCCYPQHPISYQDDEGYPFIDKAIAVNNSNLVEYFLRKAPNLVNAYDKRERTFISKAIEADDTSIASLLWSQGADLNLLTTSSTVVEKTKLIYLATCKDMEKRKGADKWIEFLSAHGYSVPFEKRDEIIETCLRMTELPFRQQVYLREKGRSAFCSGLLRLSHCSIQRVLLTRQIVSHSTLIEPVANITAQYLLFGEVPACYETYMEDTGTAVLATCTLSTPQDFEAVRTVFPRYKLTDTDCEGNTLLHRWASRGVLHNLIEYLVEQVPKLLHIANKHGRTPLACAICPFYGSNFRIVKFFIESGADMHVSSPSVNGTRKNSMLVKALSYDLSFDERDLEMDLTKKSCTYLLLKNGYYQVDLNQSAELVEETLLESNVSRSSSRYQKKTAEVHLFIKKVFKHLGQGFVIKRGRLRVVLWMETYLTPQIIELIGDYFSLKDWSHIPGADTYLA